MDSVRMMIVIETRKPNVSLARIEKNKSIHWVELKDLFKDILYITFMSPDEQAHSDLLHALETLH